MATTTNFVIWTGVFMGLRPTQGDENWVAEGLIGNYTYFVISTGAKRSGEISRFPTSGAKSAPDMGHPRLVAHFGSKRKARLVGRAFRSGALCSAPFPVGGRLINFPDESRPACVLPCASAERAVGEGAPGPRCWPLARSARQAPRGRLPPGESHSPTEKSRPE